MAENQGPNNANPKSADVITSPPKAGIGTVEAIGKTASKILGGVDFLAGSVATGLTAVALSSGLVGPALVLGTAATGLFLQARRKKQEAEILSGKVEMTLGYEAGTAKEASKIWYDKKLGQSYPIISTLAGTIGGAFAGVAGITALSLLGISLTATGAWVGIAAAALGMGVYQWFVSKAEISGYEALGELNPQKQSDFWFLANLGGGIDVFSNVARLIANIRAKKALNMYKATMEKQVADKPQDSVSQQPEQTGHPATNTANPESNNTQEHPANAVDANATAEAPVDDQAGHPDQSSANPGEPNVQTASGNTAAQVA
ncbi:hypothetical protein JW962_00895 [Candidatus Dojkabacteria bacterium]|nr:hypothetical protein [Candidatus Dojkabacteria bacterium]